MANGEYKHLLARVSNPFYKAVKIQLAQQGLTMRYVIIKGVAKELGIDIPEEEMLEDEEDTNKTKEMV